MSEKAYELRDAFVARYFTGAKLPFSFCSGGRKAAVRIITRMKTRSDGAHTTYFVVGRSGQLEVKMTGTVYDSHPAADWNIEITNTGSTNSPRISKGYGTDVEFDGSDVSMWHSTGDYVSADGFDQKIEKIGKGIVKNSNGRPCDGAFPYYRLFFDGWTLDGAVGWQARWSGSFTEKNGKVCVKAGQAILDSYLKPGETFKLSSTTFLFVEGGNTEAINAWRAFYFDCIIPRPLGNKIQPLVCGASYDSALEFCFTNEKSNLECYKTFTDENIIPDVWWIDAGWYDYNIGDGHKDWVRVGTWEVDKERFPKGLKPIADAVHAKGTKFLLWLEPERVHIRTKLYNEHPEWLLTSPKDIYCGLLNLGDPEANEYISNHVNKLIRDNGIDIYRQDFNCDPDNYFRDSETEDRQGALENLHCQGYLKFWDNILAANPGLWIDSCASGGRRNDIETMKRSVPLHYSDFGYGDLPVKDAFQQTMFEWLPYFKEQPMTWTPASNDFIHLAALSPFYSFTYDLFKAYPDHKRADENGNPFELHPETRDPAAIEDMNKYLHLWKTFSKYCCGNYYEFTPQSKTFDKWQVMQFTKPGKNKGVIKALRFAENQTDHFTFDPAEIDSTAFYAVRDVLSDELSIIPGKVLAKNFTISLKPGEGVLLEYRKIRKHGERT
ncbi:MAG: alpha-galactosidase [Clostridia bacterium]|nr:alpha-galactosidase [Clostridia bacterium]